MTETAEPIEYMLTTVDNPFDPFTQYDEWSAFDTSKGYNTPQVLAQATFLSDELSEADQALAIQQAIEAVITVNASGMHRRVRRGQVEQG